MKPGNSDKTGNHLRPKISKIRIKRFYFSIFRKCAFFGISTEKAECQWSLKILLL